jgi:hypothetical protein
MNTQTPKTEEAKAFAAYRSFNANPRPAVRGDQGIRCEYCKKEGHKKEECWCLHPHLQPKGPRKGGFNKGSDRRQGEKSYREEKEEKKGYAVRGEGAESTQKQS